MSAAPWVTLVPTQAPPRRRLFCFPHAGSGMAAYRAWARDLPGVELALVQLPGREARMREPPARRMRDLVAELAPAIAPHLDAPFAFFGHSMGAHVAFETARALRAEGHPQPHLLVVSGNRAPRLPYPRPRIHHLGDDLIVKEFERLGGTQPEILADRQLLSLLLPILRADLELCETYEYVPAPALDCDIVAFAGARDPDVPVAAVEAWRGETRGRFALNVLDGGHFFLVEERGRFLDLLARALTGAAAEA